MNPLQFLKFALHGLWRQKTRTALTTVGVTVGTCALAFSLALGLGLRAFIDKEFQGRDDFWRIIVMVEDPPTDESKLTDDEKAKVAVQIPMNDDRKARIREALIDMYFSGTVRKPVKTLTPDALKSIEKVPGVAEVRSFHTGRGWLTTPTTNKRLQVSVVSGPLEDLDARRIIGRLPASPDSDEIVLSELALYQLDQFGVRDDKDLEQVIGKEVSLEIGGNNDDAMLASSLLGRKLPDPTESQARALKKVRGNFLKALPAFGLTPEEQADLLKLLATSKEPTDENWAFSNATEKRTYRVCGIVRLYTREEQKKLTPLDSRELSNNHAFLPPKTGEKHFGALPWVKNHGLYRVDVRVKPGGDLPGTVKAIEDMGFRTWSGAKWFAAAKREVTLIAAGLNLFAFIALFVAAVGITNTLVTSVIERTKEIGILRAVGATRSQIMSLFLLEGSLIGLAGALLGLGLARGLAAWADEWVKGLIQGQMDGRPMLSETIFIFPWWLWVASVVFAVGVTTLAALYPARRAARIHPIEALRYG